VAPERADPPLQAGGSAAEPRPEADAKAAPAPPEIDKLQEQQQKAGYALIPLSLYFKGRPGEGRARRVQREDGVDKREDIAEREAKREIDGRGGPAR